MTRIPFCILDAFTDTPGQGNPAGVFFDDEGVLTPEQCGMICDEVHLESAFVSPADPGSGADFKLRYFTGTTRKLISRNPPALTVNVIEVPFCGHDTVAVTVALAHTRRIKVASDEPLRLRYQTPVGILAVDFRAKVVLVTLHQNAPEFSPPLSAEPRERIAAALGIRLSDLAADLPVQRVSTGTPWLMVPVSKKELVDTVSLNFPAITQISRETNTFGLYVFAHDEEESARDDGRVIYIWSRCFAPIAGLNEDPVTGSASGALGGYLAARGWLEKGEIIVGQQGFGGGRGGAAEISVVRNAQGAVGGVDVMGQAVLIAEGSIVAPTVR